MAENNPGAESLSAEQVFNYIKALCEKYSLWPNNFVFSNTGREQGISVDDYDSSFSDWWRTFLFVKHGDAFLPTPELGNLEARLAEVASEAAPGISPEARSEDSHSPFASVKEIGRTVRPGGFFMGILPNYPIETGDSWHRTEESLIVVHPAGFSVKLGSYGPQRGRYEATIKVISAAPDAFEHTRRLFIKGGLYPSSVTHIHPQEVSLLVEGSKVAEGVIGHHAGIPSQPPTSLEGLADENRIRFSNLEKGHALTLSFGPGLESESAGIVVRTQKGDFDLGHGTLYVVTTQHNHYRFVPKGVVSTTRSPAIS